MSTVKFIVFLCVMMLINAPAYAYSKQRILDRHLFLSVVDQDFDKFKESLRLGADPNAPTNGDAYRTSALCESTKPGNGEYLSVLIESIENTEVWKELNSRKSPMGCAIDNKNLEAFKLIISTGIDVNAVVNPDAPEKFHRKLLGKTRSSPEIAWYILQHAEPDKKQIKSLVWKLERFGGFEDSSSVQYYEKIANWLVERGVDVNLAPPVINPRALKPGYKPSSGQWLWDRQLYLSVLDKNWDSFEKYIKQGGNPNAKTNDRHYKESALCESTKKGNDKYLNAIVDSLEAVEIRASVLAFETPTNCAIEYRNISAIEKLVTLGLDLEAVVNPDEPEKVHTTLLDIALVNKYPEFVLYLLQNIELKDEQILKLVVALESFGGYENFKSVGYYQNIANWLENKGVKVNLASPITDPRATPRGQ